MALFHSFLMAKQYSVVCIHHLIHPLSMDSCCLRVSVVVNSASVNIGMHVSFYISIFSGCMPRSGLQNHMITLFLVFSGNLILSSIVDVAIYIPTNSVEGFPFFLTLSSRYYS